MSFQNWHKEFDKFWPEHLKVSNIFTLIGSFWEKYILLELKRYRGVIFHETKEGYKIWRGIDFSFQNWYKEFDKFWPHRSKVWKISSWIGSFWAKYILLELKRTEAVSFMKLKRDKKFGEESICFFKFDIRNLTSFDRALESSENFHFNWLLLSKVYIVWAKEYRGVISHFIEEWCRIWRKTDLLLGKWHEFGKFSPEH